MNITTTRTGFLFFRSYITTITDTTEHGDIEVTAQATTAVKSVDEAIEVYRIGRAAIGTQEA